MRMEKKATTALLENISMQLKNCCWQTESKARCNPRDVEGKKIIEDVK